MEQSQQILDEIKDLKKAVEAQTGRVSKLERWTRMPHNYRGDGSDIANIGSVVREEMKDALGEFFSPKRLIAVLVVGVPLIKAIVDVINAGISLVR